MDAVLADTREWHSAVVVPLRAIRRCMKGGVGQFPIKPTEALRAKIKALELEAEQLQQLQLEAAVSGHSIGAGDVNVHASTAMANLQTYFSALQLRPGSEDSEDLKVMVTESMRLTPLGS